MGHGKEARGSGGTKSEIEFYCPGLCCCCFSILVSVLVCLCVCVFIFVFFIL